MSGRAAGYCAGFGMPGYAGRIGGVGLGRGAGPRGRFFSGGGRGWRNMFYATGLPGWMRFGGYAASTGFAAPYRKPEPDAERRLLEDEAEALKGELDSINKRLSELESEGKAEQTPK